MSKSKLWLLLRVQLRGTFFGTPKDSSEERTKKDKLKRSPARRRRSGNASIIISLVVILLVFSMLLSSIAYVLHAIGLDSLTLLIGMVGASLFCLVTTVYQTNGFLFGFKDYDMTMSLPFPTSTVVACRVLILYIWNLAFCAAIMGPAGVIYCIFAAPPWYFWPVYVIALLLTPLLPSVIATVIGTLIALATSRFERKGIMGTVFTIVFMILYMLVVMNMNTVLDQMETFGPQIASTLEAMWPPAQWFRQACSDFDMGSLVLFAAVSLGVFWVFCVVVGKYFVRINSALSQSGAKADFKMTAQRAARPRRALLRKEFRRLIGSSAYFMNTCIGYILVIFFSILIACLDPSVILSTFVDTAEVVDTDFPLNLGLVIAAFLSLFCTISTTTAVSVSVEGDTFWIVKTIPVSTWDILRAKQNMNLIFVLAVTLSIGICLTIAFPGSALDCITYFLLPLSLGMFMTMFGQSVGLKHADLDWTNETKMLKQGKATTICTLCGMGIGMGGFFAAMILSSFVPEMLCALFLAESGVLLIIAVLIYRRLKTQGVARFDALTYG